MKGIIARSVAIIAAGSVFSLAGAGVAAAEAVDSGSDRVTGTSATAIDVANQISMVIDQLKAAAEKADVSTVTALVDEARGVLGGLISGQRFAASAETQQLAVETSAEADRVAAELVTLQSRAAGAPDPVALLKTLLQTLIAQLSGLVDSILGSAPALPEAPIPGLPDPGLPPGLPDPGLPLPPAPLP